MALLRVWYKDENEDKHKERCSRLLATMTTTKFVKVAGMREAVSELTQMGGNDKEKFDDLKQFLDMEETEALINSRFSGKKAAPEHFTPEPLKRLRPPCAGCVISWQIPRQCFAGYYPRLLTEEQRASKTKKFQTNHSVSRSYQEKWTKKQALQQVVRVLWGFHKKQGHDCTDMPTDDGIQEALDEAIKSLKEERASADNADPASSGKGSGAGDGVPPSAAAATPGGSRARSASVSSAEAMNSDEVLRALGLDTDLDELSTDSENKNPKPTSKLPGKATAGVKAAGAKAAVKQAEGAKAKKLLGASAAAAAPTGRKSVRQVTSEADDAAQARHAEEDQVLPGFGSSSSHRDRPVGAEGLVQKPCHLCTIEP